MHTFFPCHLSSLEDLVTRQEFPKGAKWRASLFPSLLNSLKAPYFSVDSGSAKERSSLERAAVGLSLGDASTRPYREG